MLRLQKVQIVNWIKLKQQNSIFTLTQQGQCKNISDYIAYREKQRIAKNICRRAYVGYLIKC